MRIAYASDLHGRFGHYEELFELAREQECGAVVLGGDLSPRKFSKTRIIDFHRRFYEEKLFRLIETHKHERPDLRVFVIMGNDDCAANACVFESRPDLVTWIHGRAVELEPGLLIAGYSAVDITPFVLKDFERWDKREPRAKKLRRLKGLRSGPCGRKLVSFEFPKEPEEATTIEEELAPLAGELAGKDFVWVAHCPPFRSKLDKMALGLHVGSEAIREFIEQTGPRLSLHGHIHESPRMTGSFTDRIGESFAVNAGQDFRRLHAIVLDTDDPARTIAHCRIT